MNQDIEVILRKHGGFDIPVPGMTNFNRTMSKEFENEGRHLLNSVEDDGQRYKYKAIWREISKYVQERQYDGLVTKIILEDKCKKDVIQLVLKLKESRHILLKNFDVFKAYINEKMIIPLKNEYSQDQETFN